MTKMVSLPSVSAGPLSFTSQSIFLQATSPSLACLTTFHAKERLHIDAKLFEHKHECRASLRDSQTLKHVYTKCSSVGSSLYTETGILFCLFQEIGLNEKEIKRLLTQNPALRFTSFESIRSRIHSFQSLGMNDLSLCRLIAKCPDVLTLLEIGPLVSFLKDDLEGNIKCSQLERLLSSAEHKFLVGFDRKVKLLLHHGIPGERIVHVLNNVNLAKALFLKSDEEIERMLSFLNRFIGVDIIVRRPAILNFDLEVQLIPKIEFLLELGGGDEDATRAMLRKLPAVLSYSLHHLKSHVELLRSYAGLKDDEIFKIMLMFPNVISASRTTKLQPRIKFLKDCGLDSNEIFRLLIRAPLLLGLSFEDNLAYKLGFLVKIGYEYRTKELATAMGAVTRTSCENLQDAIGLFLSYGLSCEEILGMSKKHPPIFQYKCSSLTKKLEYLVQEMGREVGELLVFPAFLGYKLDDRIKHRYEEIKETRRERMSINKLLSVSTTKFLKKQKRKTDM